MENIVTCSHCKLQLRYRNTGELEVFVLDLGRKGKYIEFVVTDAKVKCLPLSGSMKCEHIKGKEMVAEVMKSVGKKNSFGFIAKAMVTGSLSIGNGGRFVLHADSITFLETVECPIGKKCRYMEPLSAATPVLDETPSPFLAKVPVEIPEKPVKEKAA